MGFVRTRMLTAVPATVGPAPAPGQSTRVTGEIILVGCVKTKAPEASPARDLYLSPLFERRRRYAESSGQPWYILSAEHGLLDPGSIIEPYDVYLADQTADYRQAWGEWVAAKLTRVRGSIDGLVIEVHAGTAYVDAIEEPLRRRGGVYSLHWPGCGGVSSLPGTTGRARKHGRRSRSSRRCRVKSNSFRIW
jgi:hypothetical protein